MKHLIVLVAFVLSAFATQAQTTVFTIPVQGTVAGQAEGLAPMIALYDFDNDATIAPLLASEWITSDVTFTLTPSDADFRAFASAIAQEGLMLSTGHTINGIQKSAAATLSACFDADLTAQPITSIRVAYRDVHLVQQGAYTAFAYTLEVALVLDGAATAMSK